jgi:hypothetical protein
MLQEELRCHRGEARHMLLLGGQRQKVIVVLSAEKQMEDLS